MSLGVNSEEFTKKGSKTPEFFKIAATKEEHTKLFFPL